VVGDGETEFGEGATGVAEAVLHVDY
jgi:hypothetical protein